MLIRGKDRFVSKRLVAFAVLCLGLESGCGIIAQSVYGWTETKNDVRRGRQNVKITSTPEGAEVGRSEAKTGPSAVVGITPTHDEVPYKASQVLVGPSSPIPLIAGLVLDVAASIFAGLNDDVPLSPFIGLAVIDFVSIFAHLTRGESRGRQSAASVYHYRATMPDGRSQVKPLLVPSSAHGLHFTFASAPTGDLQIIAPLDLQVSVDGKAMALDADGGIFLDSIPIGTHKIVGRANGYETVKKVVSVERNRTTQVELSKLGLEATVIARRERMQLPRHYCVLILRSAKAHPAVFYEIQHASKELSPSVRLALKGKLPAEISPFPIGDFEVIFTKGQEVLRKAVSANKGEEINLRADFRNKRVNALFPTKRNRRKISNQAPDLRD